MYLKAVHRVHTHRQAQHFGDCFDPPRAQPPLGVQPPYLHRGGAVNWVPEGSLSMSSATFFTVRYLKGNFYDFYGEVPEGNLYAYLRLVIFYGKVPEG